MSTMLQFDTSRYNQYAKIPSPPFTLVHWCTCTKLNSLGKLFSFLTVYYEIDLATLVQQRGFSCETKSKRELDHFGWTKSFLGQKVKIQHGHFGPLILVEMNVNAQIENLIVSHHLPIIQNLANLLATKVSSDGNARDYIYQGIEQDV